MTTILGADDINYNASMSTTTTNNNNNGGTECGCDNESKTK